MTGFVIPILLAMVFGLLFVYLITALQHRPSARALLLYGTVYGSVLWIVNFFIIGGAGRAAGAGGKKARAGLTGGSPLRALRARFLAVDAVSSWQ